MTAMRLAPYQSILAEPLAFWAANADSENIPEIVRCCGLAPITDYTRLTFFIGEAFGRQFIQNITTNPRITLTGTSVPTYESYQYKGVFVSIRTCNEQEVEQQRQYLDRFTDVVAAIGYSKEGFYNSYFHQPSYAITFEVQEIFEQTPYKGTGSMLAQKEVSNG